MRRTTAKDECEYEFPFTVLAEKHNAVIRTIREIPPWEWGGEFLELEPQVLRFLGTFARRYPECAAFRRAYTLASALAVYRISSHKPKNLSEQERTDCIAANRDLVDEYSDALLRAYKEIFDFLFKTNGDFAHTAAAEIIKAIVHEHEQTRQMIKETNGLLQTCNRTPVPTNRRSNHHQTAATSKHSRPSLSHHTNRGKSHQQKSSNGIVPGTA